MGDSVTPAKDIMMAVSSEHALREAELLTLRQIGDAIATTNRAIEATNRILDKMGNSVDDARERLARIEGQNEARPDLRIEIEKLKEDLQQRHGIGKLMTVLKDFTPWILGLAAFAMAAAGRIHIG